MVNMKKGFVLLLVIFSILDLYGQENMFETLLSKDGLLQIVRSPSVADYSQMLGKGKISKIPAYNKKSGQNWQVDLRSCDLSSVKIENQEEDLFYADFDSKTIWPSKGLVNFNPNKIMQLGKSPGLSISQLHQEHITGKNVGIAIIDQALLVNHIEYKEQLKLYEKIHWFTRDEAQMHGPAVASIAVGKTIGVAPESDLYFIACWMGNMVNNKFVYDMNYVAESIDRIIKINSILQKEKKIRAISISLGINPSMKGYQNVIKAIERAREDNIETFYVDSHEYYGAGRESLNDPDLNTSYDLGLFYSKYKMNTFDKIIVPMDSRTTASPTGDEDYVFYRMGGMSWTVPYIAGLYVLSCQVNPTINDSIFWNSLKSTSKNIYKNGEIIGKIVQPKELIADLQKK